MIILEGENAKKERETEQIVGEEAITCAAASTLLFSSFSSH